MHFCRSRKGLVRQGGEEEEEEEVEERRRWGWHMIHIASFRRFPHGSSFVSSCSVHEDTPSESSPYKDGDTNHTMPVEGPPLIDIDQETSIDREEWRICES